MAVVYRATDTWYDEPCAIKLLQPHNATRDKTRRRFVSEARTMAALDHPNIVRVRDIGRDDEHYWFAMELVEGQTVAEYLRDKGKVDIRLALDWVFQVLKGLEYAHTARVVHRDVKPHNMLLDPAGLVKLTDFGIARVLETQGTRITGVGDTLGTLAYMAPEQRADARVVGPQADVYGVGATLYILATGRRPFDLAMATIDPSVLQRLPAPLRDVVRRSTAHQPQDRYRSAVRMAEAVSAAWHEIAPGSMSLTMDDFTALEDSDTIMRVSGTPVPPARD